VGMRVEVVFDDVTPQVTLPKFKRGHYERDLGTAEK
jgi:hypothetical protein